MVQKLRWKNHALCGPLDTFIGVTILQLISLKITNFHELYESSIPTVLHHRCIFDVQKSHTETVNIYHADIFSERIQICVEAKRQ